MKKSFKFFIIAFLLSVFTYVCKIDSIPEDIILYNGEELNLGKFPGISLNIENQDVLAVSNITETKNTSSNVEVKLFNSITVKEVSLNIMEEATVIPVGQVAGLKLYTSSALVVGMSEIVGVDGQKYKPYLNSGIQEGDRIIKVEEKEITDTNTLIEVLNNSKGNSLKIEYVRDGEIFSCEIAPVKQLDGSYKIGLWVRDSSAGIGTLTFYEPSTGNFAALGHGITDIDTGELLEISNGEFLTSKIISIVKGQKGSPRKNTR